MNTATYWQRKCWEAEDKLKINTETLKNLIRQLHIDLAEARENYDSELQQLHIDLAALSS